MFDYLFAFSNCHIAYCSLAVHLLFACCSCRVLSYFFQFGVVFFLSPKVFGYSISNFFSDSIIHDMCIGIDHYSIWFSKFKQHNEPYRIPNQELNRGLEIKGTNNRNWRRRRKKQREKLADWVHIAYCALCIAAAIATVVAKRLFIQIYIDWAVPLTLFAFPYLRIQINNYENDEKL